MSTRDQTPHADVMREVYSRSVTRADDAPCASARHCVSEPPSRVAYAGDVCAGCRRVRERMAAELRARRAQR